MSKDLETPVRDLVDFLGVQPFRFQSVIHHISKQDRYDLPFFTPTMSSKVTILLNLEKTNIASGISSHIFLLLMLNLIAQLNEPA